jgi:hypothetical protein
VVADDLGDEGKAQSEPATRLLATGPGEPPREGLELVRGHPGPVVDDLDPHQAGCGAHADLDRRPGVGVRDRVVD